MTEKRAAGKTGLPSRNQSFHPKQRGLSATVSMTLFHPSRAKQSQFPGELLMLTPMATAPVEAV
jgi:hypothetical protein